MIRERLSASLRGDQACYGNPSFRDQDLITQLHLVDQLGEVLPCLANACNTHSDGIVLHVAHSWRVVQSR